MKRPMTIAAAAAVLAALPATAGAEQANPYTPEQICGPGFGRIATTMMPSVDGKRVMARTYLMYDASTRQNCATTVKYAGVGRPSHVFVGLQKRGGPLRTDGRDRRYAYYAGPVKVHAPGTEVQYSGSYRIGVNSGGFESPWGWGR